MEGFESTVDSSRKTLDPPIRFFRFTVAEGFLFRSRGKALGYGDKSWEFEKVNGLV
jgi:hypothetical protein